jgi:hypothetical protein
VRTKLHAGKLHLEQEHNLQIFYLSNPLQCCLRRELRGGQYEAPVGAHRGPQALMAMFGSSGSASSLLSLSARSIADRNSLRARSTSPISFRYQNSLDPLIHHPVTVGRRLQRLRHCVQSVLGGRSVPLYERTSNFQVSFGAGKFTRQILADLIRAE